MILNLPGLKNWSNKDCNLTKWFKYHNGHFIDFICSTSIPHALIILWRNIAPTTPQTTFYSFFVLHHTPPCAAPSDDCPWSNWSTSALCLAHPNRRKCLGIYKPPLQRKPTINNNRYRTGKAYWDHTEIPLTPWSSPTGSGWSHPGISLPDDFLPLAVIPSHILIGFPQEHIKYHLLTSPHFRVCFWRI